MSVANKKRQTWLCGIYAIVLIFLCLLPARVHAGEVAIASAEGHYNPLIRVKLTKMNITEQVDIVLETPYALYHQAGVLYLKENSELAIRFTSGQMYLYYEQLSVAIGMDVTLVSQNTGNSANENVGFRQKNYSALYRGDLRLYIEENKIIPVLSLHVEEYLLGVVPYEMSESFPLEALKAQSIAARTYALRRQGSEKNYDVVDNTNDQVFKGYIEGYNKVEQAIAQTAGICAFYKGKLAQCYYSASNGGQMEEVSTVWSTREDFGYYKFGHDKYDVENPKSIVRKFVLKKKLKNADDVSWRLKEYVALELEEELKEKGLSQLPDNIWITNISDVKTLEPKGESNSILMTKIEMKVKLKGRTQSSAVENESDLPVVVVYIENGQSNTVAPTQSPEPIYGEWQMLEGEYEITIPIFSEAETIFAMDISPNYENEIWTVVENEEEYVLEARRYGHGVGMSQRGAQWMALEYDKNYQDIMKFYYPGITLLRYPDVSITGNNHVDSALKSTQIPAIEPTPKPTLMPQSFSPNEGEWIAVVSEIEDDSTLNLRKEPNLGAQVLMTLLKHQELLVLDDDVNEGWVLVQTDEIQGYVMESFTTRK